MDKTLNGEYKNVMILYFTKIFKSLTKNKN